nr:4Fe-4S double cluster binding domain-containing protein [Maliibacterium massiliense]
MPLDDATFARWAREAGFYGVRLCAPQPAGAGVWAVLAMPCRRTAQPGTGQVFVSDYYRASNASYHAARALAARASEAGVRALAHPRADIKDAMYRAGWGLYGKNSLIHHPVLGSFMVAAVVQLDADWPVDAPLQPEKSDCGNCRACVDACPMGALTGTGNVNRKRCLRQWMEHPQGMPEEVREKMGVRLLGCEDCQQACPKNARVPAHAYDTEEGACWRADTLLAADGAFYRALAQVIGANYARRNKLRPLAALAAGHMPGADAHLRALLAAAACDPAARTADCARWSLARMAREEGENALAYPKQLL